MEPLAELMDEHFVLLDVAGDVRRALKAGDVPAAVEALANLEQLLGQHVGREERGVFAAMKEQGDFAYAVDELELEHLSFDQRLSRLAPAAAGFADEVLGLLAELREHIDKENLGVFPVAVVSLDGTGWETVSRAHAEQPSFLTTTTS
ncbi:hemerythrin domain-containing protein [Kribbella sp. VKM Ac-2571]|uniref:hemerythrin domain-containing protein n=1 Tax=Kribbella sp. VKM Ac-2571 TaxID=2512222 RepID=UPI001414F5F4|nr:hemerythrin domain-containing protein [Kribbella sp. VKM Ac-2571]